MTATDRRCWQTKFGTGVPVITYGLGVRADFRASNVRSDFHGTSYQLDANGRSYLVRLPQIGNFNVYNSLAAIAGAYAMGVDVRAAVLALARCPAVPGRLEAGACASGSSGCLSITRIPTTR